jgi:predicted GIY-YIG superfamily endonuclease
MILEFITRAIRQEEEIKGTQRRKKSNYPYFQII